MNLVASLIVKNERRRYLEPCIESLLTFCDEIRIVDDFSTDGSYDWLLGRDRVYMLTNPGSAFFAHEGTARNHLLDWTLDGKPTHVLAIDADEFVADGRALRAAIDMDEFQTVWTLRMQEVWGADEGALWVRTDGGWKPHDAPIMWKVPEGGLNHPDWRIQDKPLSSGREPVAVRRHYAAALKSGTEMLHFGWANEEEREGRYRRYTERLGGHFHATRHIRSIMLPRRSMRLEKRMWPAALLPQKAAILEHVGDVVHP